MHLSQRGEGCSYSRRMLLHCSAFAFFSFLVLYPGSAWILATIALIPALSVYAAVIGLSLQAHCRHRNCEPADRPCFRFRLSSLLATVAAICVLCALTRMSRDGFLFVLLLGPVLMMFVAIGVLVKTPAQGLLAFGVGHTSFALLCLTSASMDHDVSRIFRFVPVLFANYHLHWLYMYFNIRDTILNWAGLAIMGTATWAVIGCLLGQAKTALRRRRTASGVLAKF